MRRGEVRATKNPTPSKASCRRFQVRRHKEGWQQWIWPKRTPFVDMTDDNQPTIQQERRETDGRLLQHKSFFRGSPPTENLAVSNMGEFGVGVPHDKALGRNQRDPCLPNLGVCTIWSITNDFTESSASDWLTCAFAQQSFSREMCDPI